MKKQYISPACTIISVCTALLLPASQNEYWSEKEAGLIHFDDTEVDASEAD